MLDYKADMMLLTETWLKPSKTAIVNELTPPGYSFIGECRTEKRGGGTGLLFKSEYKFAKMPSPRFKTFEVLDVKTTHSERPLRVIIIYRSPTSPTKSFLDELALYISELAVVREEILMAGDFNLHFHLPNASGVQYLKQILADNNMQQHVTKPTHRSGNLLDLVITRVCSNIVASTDICESSISDHYSVIFPLHVTKPRSSSQMRQVRNFKRMDHASFEADLISELADVDTEQGVEIVLHQYEKALKSSIDKHAPMRTRTTQSRKREPWYNDDIHNARQLRRINETRWRETKLEIHLQIFVQHRSEVNTMISRAKQQYYEHKLAATDQKTCFKVVSELLDTAGTTLPDSTNNQHLCDDFAKFFSDKITLIRENIQRRVQYVDSRVCEETDRSAVQYTLDELAPTTEAELIRILRNSSDKTCCLDAIPTNLIKKYASLHIPYLVAIVNNSFKEGLFPSALRTAVVRPLLKKDNLDRNTMNNYRPISNIPFISKLMEKVAVSRVVEHLSNNNLMEEYQSAYRADHSTETALLKVHHDISSALDESHAVALVILDLSAAFDTIDQCQLLSLLNAEFGVHAKALSWLETYLEARTQRVKIDDAMSETIPLTCGVPQGSVLGPVLFTIYTMPMQRIIRKHGVVYHKYADDTQLYVTYKPNVLGDMQRAVKQLEDCISEIRVWMINRMLKLNDNKTDMVIYMSQYHLNKYGRCDISIGDSTISPVECVRNLGVQIDQHLTMDKQVTAVCKACNFHLYRLSSIRRYITTDAARSVVQALITSRLDYCNSLLANLTNTQMKRLKSIQHKAARLVTRTPLREHITPVLKQLHWLPVECRITYTLMVLVYKCVNGTAPAYLCRLIQPKCRDSRLRQPSDLELHRPVPKKAIGTAAFGFVGPDRWNKLPERLRESASLNIFKRDLKTHLFSNPL